MRSLPMREGSGVLRVTSHRKDRVSGLHVRSERHLCAAQSGRAQPPWLEEDKDGHPRSAGPQEVYL